MRVACAQISRITWENVVKTVGRQYGTHSDIYPVFLWDSPLPEAVNTLALSDVKHCRRRHQENEVVARWMTSARGPASASCVRDFLSHSSKFSWKGSSQ